MITEYNKKHILSTIRFKNQFENYQHEKFNLTIFHVDKSFNFDSVIEFFERKMYGFNENKELYKVLKKNNIHITKWFIEYKKTKNNLLIKHTTPYNKKIVKYLFIREY